MISNLHIMLYVTHSHEISRHLSVRPTKYFAHINSQYVFLLQKDIDIIFVSNGYTVQLVKNCQL